MEVTTMTTAQMLEGLRTYVNQSYRPVDNDEDILDLAVGFLAFVLQTYKGDQDAAEAENNAKKN